MSRKAFKVDEAFARKVLKIVDAGLVKGMGDASPGKMCVEAAVNYAMGAEHGDEPKCVAPELRDFKVALNDQNWSTDRIRARGMRRLAIAQLGSNRHFPAKKFYKEMLTLLAREWATRALEYYSKSLGIGKDYEALRIKVKEFAQTLRQKPTLKTLSSIRDYFAFDIEDYPDYGLDGLIDNLRFQFEKQLFPFEDFPEVFTDFAFYLATDKFGDDKIPAFDKLLKEFAEQVVQILIKLKAPGTQYLWLTERRK